jgi:hypothetical protein
MADTYNPFAPFVLTDQLDYQPGSTVYINTGNFSQGGTLKFAIVNAGADGLFDTADDIQYDPFYVTDGETGDGNTGGGAIETTWIVPNDALNRTLRLTATEIVDADGNLNTTADQTAIQAATTTFTDGIPPTVNLTYPSSQGTLNNAIFANSTFKAGTGVVDSFLRVQAQGNNTTEQGYNSDFRPKQFDEDTSGQRNKSLLTAAVPIAYIGATPYLEFRLDVNESQQEETTYLSLDALKIYVTGNPSITGFTPANTTGTIPPDTTGTFPTTGTNAATLVYDLDAGNLANWVGLKVTPGSGYGDVSVFVPANLFYNDAALTVPKAQYITLYSAFGYEGTTTGPVSSTPSPTTYPSSPQQWSAQGGFEEWARGVGRPIQASDITGSKFIDTNGNGVKDIGELPLAGVTVYLDQNNNGVLDTGERSTVTDASGNYTFTNLVVGLGADSTYRVREVVPMGYTQTAPLPGTYSTGVTGEDATVADFGNASVYDPTITVTLNSAQVTYNLPAFGNFPNFSISGTKYEDKTGNGITADDTGLGGVTIFIDKDGSGTLTAGDPQTTTATDGTWSFSNLSYDVLGKKVYEVLPSGYVQTVGNAGYTLPSVGGQNQTNLNFANFKLFNISGTKYEDKTGDGITPDDTGLGGVIIFIDKDGSGTLTAGDPQTTTAANGTWSFSNLGSDVLGKTVYEVLPSGYVQTVGNAGYTLPSVGGQNQTNLNFANFADFSISGFKKEDLSGVGDPNTLVDWTAGPVTIFIDDNGNASYDPGIDRSTVTGTNGAWSFSNLSLADVGKKVYEVVPTDYVQTIGVGGITITNPGSGGTLDNLIVANFKEIVIPPPPVVNIIKTAGNAADGQTLFINGPQNVTFKYQVTTTEGSVQNVVVKDDNGTPGDTSDDFFADPVLNGSFNTGDTNTNNLLDPGETWQFTKTVLVSDPSIGDIYSYAYQQISNLKVIFSNNPTVTVNTSSSSTVRGKGGNTRQNAFDTPESYTGPNLGAGNNFGFFDGDALNSRKGKVDADYARGDAAITNNGNAISQTQLNSLLFGTTGVDNETVSESYVGWPGSEPISAGSSFKTDEGSSNGEFIIQSQNFTVSSATTVQFAFDYLNKVIAEVNATAPSGLSMGMGNSSQSKVEFSAKINRIIGTSRIPVYTYAPVQTNYTAALNAKGTSDPAALSGSLTSSVANLTTNTTYQLELRGAARSDTRYVGLDQLTRMNTATVTAEAADPLLNGQQVTDNDKATVVIDANNLVQGTSGPDTLTGTGANDTLVGLQGNDTVSGGAGNDLFVLAPGDGTDTIQDFSRVTGNWDKIGLTGGLSYGSLSFSGNDIINTSTSEILATLTGVNTSTLTSADFTVM